MSNRFRKSQRICSEKEVNRLFSEGSNARKGNLLIKWVLDDATAPDFKVLIVAPKRHIRSAAVRNRVKRVAREAFRTNQDMLRQFVDRTNKILYFAVIYTGDSDISFRDFEQLYLEALHKVMRTVESGKG